MQDWSDQAKGLFLAITGVLVLTPDALLVRLISADEWSLLFWRGLLTGLALALYIGGRDRAFRTFTTVSNRGLLIAALYACNTVLFVISIRHTAVANTLVIMSTAPLFAAVMSSVFLREHAPLRTWLTASIGFVCIAAIMGESLGSANFIGDGAAVGMAVLQGALFTLLRREGHVDTAPIISIGGFMMALMVLPLASPASLTGADWPYMLILGAVILPISFVLTTSAPKYIPAAEVSLAFLLETVLGPIWVWMVLGEVPPELTVFGGAILIAALTVHTVLGLRSKRV